MAEPDSFGRAVSVPRHRAWRAARLGGLALNVAGNVAAKRTQSFLRGDRVELRDLLLAPSNITRITTELARMRGAAMKLGQLISMDAGDILPPELSQIMARLRAEADFMPPSQLKQVLTQAWGRNWLKQFRHFDVRPIAAASIGQVHKATLKDGRCLAIKVQYPGVAQSIDSDVANVAALVKLSGLIPKGFEIDAYVDEARKQLHEETDYLREAEHLGVFRDLLLGDERYEIPQVLDDMTTSNILTMSFIESQPLEDVAQHDEKTRNRIATDLIELVLRELFEFGIVQSDPNFANFRFNAATGRLVLLDFGATRTLDTSITGMYRNLIKAGLANQTEQMQEAALGLGLWDQTTAPEHVAQLLEMMQQVFAVLKVPDSVYDFANQDLTKKLSADGLALAQSGFVPPPVPIDVLFIQRKLAGVFLIASTLRAKVPLKSAIERRLGRSRST